MACGAWRSPGAGDRSHQSLQPPLLCFIYFFLLFFSFCFLKTLLIFTQKRSVALHAFLVWGMCDKHPLSKVKKKKKKMTCNQAEFSGYLMQRRNKRIESGNLKGLETLGENLGAVGEGAFFSWKKTYCRYRKSDNNNHFPSCCMSWGTTRK